MATVNLEDLKPNSHVYKESIQKEEKQDKKKLETVVKKGGVVSTKKSLGDKFQDIFLSEDVKDIKGYIIFDTIIPGIKNLILDVIEMAFFGSSGSRRSTGSRREKEHTNYSSYYKSEYKSSRRDRRDREERRYEADEKVDYRRIILKYRDDAERVVDQMRERIRTYETVSIADLFELVGITGKYTDNNWGWVDENDIGIKRVSDGYLIDVTEAVLLD